MILACVLLLISIQVFYLIAEVWYERDWPRSTLRGFLITLGIALLCFSAFGQAVYVSQPIQTSGPNVPSGGGPLPQALWVANATVAVCAHPASSYANCVANPVVTYTDSTAGTACGAAAQLVLLPGNTCTASAGVTATVGFWYAGGTVDYYVVSSYGTFGPFSISSAASAATMPIKWYWVDDYLPSAYPVTCASVTTTLDCAQLVLEPLLTAAPGAGTNVGLQFGCGIYPTNTGVTLNPQETLAGSLYSYNLKGCGQNGTIIQANASLPNGVVYCAHTPLSDGTQFNYPKKILIQDMTINPNGFAPSDINLQCFNVNQRIQNVWMIPPTQTASVPSPLAELVWGATNDISTWNAQFQLENNVSGWQGEFGHANFGKGAEVAVSVPTVNVAITSVTSVSGVTAVYNGTFTNGGSNAFKGFSFVITGDANAGNNGTFTATASTTGAITLLNSGAVAEGSSTGSAAFNYGNPTFTVGGVPTVTSTPQGSGYSGTGTCAWSGGTYQLLPKCAVTLSGGGIVYNLYDPGQGVTSVSGALLTASGFSGGSGGTTVAPSLAVGGSGYSANAQIMIGGQQNGLADVPCSTMNGTPINSPAAAMVAPTIVSGVITAVSGAAFSGCGAPMYAYVWDGPPLHSAYQCNYCSDGTIDKDVFSLNSARDFAMDLTGGGNIKVTNAHCQNQGAWCAKVPKNDTFTSFNMGEEYLGEFQLSGGQGQFAYSTLSINGIFPRAIEAFDITDASPSTTAYDLHGLDCSPLILPNDFWQVAGNNFAADSQATAGPIGTNQAEQLNYCGNNGGGQIHQSPPIVVTSPSTGAGINPFQIVAPGMTGATATLLWQMGKDVTISNDSIQCAFNYAGNATGSAVNFGQCGLRGNGHVFNFWSTNTLNIGLTSDCSVGSTGGSTGNGSLCTGSVYSQASTALYLQAAANLYLGSNGANVITLNTTNQFYPLTNGTVALGIVGNSFLSSNINTGVFNTSLTSPLYDTTANCASAASPAVCAAAPVGHVVVASAATTVVVDTTAVTATSDITLTEDSSTGSLLSVTCNATPATSLTVTARTAATSFTITTNAPITNPRCITYHIFN